MSVVFALDSSGKTAGVCVLQNDRVVYRAGLHQGLTHSETLLPLAMQAFEETKLVPADVTLYAVAGGPGSFTGLRIGMALAKGLALPHATPAVAVSTLAALARACAAEGLRGTVVPALDARRGEVYWAAFHCDGTAARLLPDIAGKVEDILQKLPGENGPIFFVGDGAHLCYNKYDYDHRVQRIPDGFVPLLALGVALLAGQKEVRMGAESAAQMHPCYLRLSQAERERSARLAENGT